MPPCVERTLALLCRYVDCLQQQTPPPFSHYTDQLERDFSLQGAQEPLQLRMIQVLQMQALQEKFASDHISKIELAAQYLNAKNYPNGLDILISLFKDIREFDIDVTLTIIEECRRRSNVLNGRDVVLLMGGTGAGTSNLSLLISFLSNCSRR
jgi:hypothetical protein